MTKAKGGLEGRMAAAQRRGQQKWKIAAVK